ncbi:MAG: DinB family protein [Candidatus Acidiferrales bacterium]
MASAVELRDSILGAWKTNNRVTIYLVEHLPAKLWEAAVPGAPRRTVRMIAGHIHNARCMWLKTLGKENGIAAPGSVDRRKVKAKDLILALGRSGAGIGRLLELGCERGGSVPATRAYVWRNLPLDVGHVLGYFIAHEGHHRGQIVMLARQLGYRLPAEVTGGLWQWAKRTREG